MESVGRAAFTTACACDDDARDAVDWSNAEDRAWVAPKTSDPSPYAGSHIASTARSHPRCGSASRANTSPCTSPCTSSSCGASPDPTSNSESSPSRADGSPSSSGFGPSSCCARDRSSSRARGGGGARCSTRPSPERGRGPGALVGLAVADCGKACRCCSGRGGISHSCLPRNRTCHLNRGRSFLRHPKGFRWRCGRHWLRPLLRRLVDFEKC
mmetsp:Transcript_40146/g.86669  ORF Transcript_40146/g.86669 Transcript_40146/m.86669 type:complete len:213 (+) Transcript_40146:192-830(+)